jgi:hypothetical protein
MQVGASANERKTYVPPPGETCLCLSNLHDVEKAHAWKNNVALERAKRGLNVLGFRIGSNWA